MAGFPRRVSPTALGGDARRVRIERCRPEVRPGDGGAGIDERGVRVESQEQRPEAGKAEDEARMEESERE